MKHASRVGLIFLLGAALGATSASAAADPALLNLVMPDAKVVAGFQVAQAQVSPLGQYLLSQIPANADFDKMIAATGFDPRRDLQEIVAASAGGSRPTGLVIGRGVFQPARISMVAGMTGGSASDYKGVQIVMGKGSPNGVAFLDASTVVAGDAASIKAAIDRRAGGSQLSAALRQKALEASTSNDAWIVTLTPLTELLAGSGAAVGAVSAQQANLFQTVQQLAGGLKFGASTVRLTGEAVTRSNEDAQALADILRFLASMAQSNAKGPNAARASSLIDAAKFSAEGAVMRLSVELPESEIEQMIKPAPRNRAAVR